MLLTRCPDCDTTFRVTDDALKKANGQVRCGRCASVFNAYAERRDAPDERRDAPDEPAEAPAARPSESTIARESSGAAGLAVAAPTRAPRAGSDGVQPLAATARGRQPAADPIDDLSVADVVAQIEQSAVDED